MRHNIVILRAAPAGRAGDLLAPWPAAAANRSAAVDALRGLAILAMVLVGAEPLGVLPAWMYHAQEPPPAHAMNVDLPGLTWPDIVFPTFIFTLGVAIPLALSRRLERGASRVEILRGALARGLLLVFFALFRQHFDSALSGLQPDPLAWIAGLLGFAALFAIFTRLPDGWSRTRRRAIRAAGWTTAVLMFALVEYPDGSRARPDRIDIILLILAYCAVFGTIVWLATRQHLLARLGVLALLVATRLASSTPGWLNAAYAFDPVPWLYRPSILLFLCIVIPGTIAGDMLLEWRRTASSGDDSWSRGRVVALAGVLLLAVPIVLAGIQTRHVFATTAIAALLCLAAGALARRPLTQTESLIARLVQWGAFWLMLGLMLDPLEGGTKKVPETFAWFFQGAGLAIFLLVVFTIVTDVLRKRRWVQLLIDNGQNPMIGYVANGMLILPLLGLTTIKDAVDSRLFSPWVAFAWSVLVTLLIAYAVRFFSRRQLFWRT